MVGVAGGAWATPHALAPNHLAVHTLEDILSCVWSAPPELVRRAGVLCRRPELVSALLDEDEAECWRSAVGVRAAPPTGVAQLDPAGRMDHTWADAVTLLKTANALVEDLAAGVWRRGPALKPSGQAWSEGRARVIAGLVARLADEESWGKVVAFAGGKKDAKAERAVS